MVAMRTHTTGPYRGKCVIHWLAYDPEGPIAIAEAQHGGMRMAGGNFRHGCRPTSTVPDIGDGGQFTGEIEVANCLECLGTEKYKQALEEHRRVMSGGQK